MWSKRVDQFIQDLDEFTSKRAIYLLNQLERHGHLLEMPYSKALGKGLFELRTQGDIKVRILYVFRNDRAYIIHAFVKKSWAIAIQDIRYARRVQREISNIA